MFEQQLKSLMGLNSRATQAIIKYYNEQNADYQIKIANLEDALAQLDILIMYIVQIRAEVRTSLPTLPGSQKQAAYDTLDEMKTVQDAAKTVSFNLTAVMHSLRDMLKIENI